MNNERRRAEARWIFLLAKERSPEARASLLREVCAGDEALRAEVESLLANDEASGFLEGNALQSAGLGAWIDHAKQIGAYTIERRLALGASGVVYLAQQDRPRRRVALKMLRPDEVSPEGAERVRREAEILARLQHPGIAQVYEAGVVDGALGPRPWFAMEHVEGEELTAYVAERALPPREILALVAEICDAVQHAHSAGVIHRDLKPANILVRSDGRPKVLDFGIARLVEGFAGARVTRDDMVLGTAAYMSPEQAAGSARDADARTDVYSLGVILYELLAHRPPYDVRNLPLAEALRAIREDEPVALGRIRPDLRGDVETIVTIALAKEPGQRYASVRQLADDLRRHLAHQPIQGRPPSWLYRTRKLARRHRSLSAGILLALASLLVAAGGTTASLLRAREQLAVTSETLDALATAIFALESRLGFGEAQRATLEDVLDRLDQQLRVDARNRALLASRADALYALASLDETRGAPKQAWDRFHAAREARQRLLAIDPDDLELATKLSMTYAKLGDVAGALDDLGSRIAWYERAYELDDALVAAHPGNAELVEDFGWSLERMAGLACERGDFAEAARLARRRVDEAQPLADAEPKNWKYLLNLACAKQQLAGILQCLGDPESARTLVRESLSLFGRLVQLDPDRRDFVTRSVEMHAALATLAESPAEADRHMQSSFTIARQVVRSDPGRVSHFKLFRDAARRALHTALELGNVEAARAVTDAVRYDLEIVPSAGPGDLEPELTAIAVELLDAAVDRHCGDAAAADRRVDEALARLADLAAGATATMNAWRWCWDELESYATSDRTPNGTAALYQVCRRLFVTGELKTALRFLARSLTLLAGDAAARTTRGRLVEAPGASAR